MPQFGRLLRFSGRLGTAKSRPFATSPLHPDGEEQLSPVAQGHADPFAFIGDLEAELEGARPRIAALSRILFCNTMDIRLSLGVRLLAIPAPRRKIPRA
jgi:hypothetical protein